MRPAQAGRWPTNVRAEADYVDGWGRPGRLLLPVPFVEVVAPPVGMSVASTGVYRSAMIVSS